MLRIGSSPQVRGTRINCNVNIRSKRFIPAGAGNTTAQMQAAEALAVHPRRCGEHAAIISSVIKCNGSSPQVRGTPQYKPDRYTPSRFIPAGAGNTPHGERNDVHRAVHPRRCGEHLAWRRKVYQLLRFIPAGAGNTFPTPLNLNSFAVHPRRCGEHDSLPWIAYHPGGSSPQVRGTRSGYAYSDAGRRFIPAGAGNTRSCTVQRWDSSVHPRRCGEHTSQ